MVTIEKYEIKLPLLFGQVIRRSIFDKFYKTSNPHLVHHFNRRMFRAIFQPRFFNRIIYICNIYRNQICLYAYRYPIYEERFSNM